MDVFSKTYLACEHWILCLLHGHSGFKKGLKGRISVWATKVFQTKECYDKLANKPINTINKILNEEELSYPSVTFCFKNEDGQGYDLEVLKVISYSIYVYYTVIHYGIYDYYSLQSYNITGYWIQFQTGTYFTNPWRSFDFQNINLSTVWKESTYAVKSFGAMPASHDKNGSRLAFTSSSVRPSTIFILSASLNPNKSSTGKIVKYIFLYIV